MEAGRKDKEQKTNMAKKTEAAAPPEGFDVSIGRPDIDGWWNIQQGQPIVGRIIGGFLFDDKDGNENRVVVVKTVKPVMGGTQADSKELPAGSQVGVSLRAGLADLGFYVTTRAAVWILPKEKVNIGQGRSTWKFDVRTQKDSVRAERDFFASQGPSKVVKSQTDFGNIPF